MVRLLTPPLTRMPVATAELSGVVVVTVVVPVPGPAVVGVVKVAEATEPDANAVTFSVPLLSIVPLIGLAAVVAGLVPVPGVTVGSFSITMP